MANVPNALIASLKNLSYFDEEAFIATHELAQSPVSVRVNPSKEYELPPNSMPVAWCEQGYYLPQRPSFTLDPLFHAGCYYVQEASSMFIDFLLKNLLPAEQAVRALDLCAAPGGKSTLLQAALPEGSLLVANEVIKARSGILAENLSKWGSHNVVVTNNDPSDFAQLSGWFDVLLVDAPCSGSGMFRKDVASIKEWSEENVRLCAQRQQRILADVLPSLAENGLLIYATCSYSTAEDEEILDWLIEDCGLESVNISVPTEWGIISTESTKHKAAAYRFFPHLVKGEGLFVACLRKKHAEPEFRYKTKYKLTKIDTRHITPLLHASIAVSLITLQDTVLAIPEGMEAEVRVLADNFYLRKAGARVGQPTLKELIPDHDLALSSLLTLDSPRIELTEKQALQYLRREDFDLETALRGWVLVTYKNIPLGWIKSLPNRFNNYYPKEWRILMR